MPSFVNYEKGLTAHDVPEFQTAIVQGDGGKLYVNTSQPVPIIEPHQVLVKVAAVALNPCDFKMSARFPSPGATDGCDFSGTVAAIGSEAARTSSFVVGQRVFGAVHGSNPIDHSAGSFAQYVAIDAGFLFKTPSHISNETATSVGGTGLGTLGLAFYKSLGLQGTPETPVKNGPLVLVYGGSTSVGTLAIQLLRLAGYRPITTCSPSNFDLVRSYGAEEVFDYHAADVADQIKAYTKNTLSYVLDIITEPSSMKHCYAAIGRAGGRYTCLEQYPEYLHTRKTVKPQLVMGIAILGKRIALEHGYGSEADPALRDFGVSWYQKLQRVIDDGRLRPHPIKVLPGRWDGILKGLDLLRDRSVSAQKLVVRIQED